MGNVLGVILGVGNRPRQGRAVLEILFLFYLLRKLNLTATGLGTGTGVGSSVGPALPPPTSTTPLLLASSDRTSTGSPVPEQQQQREQQQLSLLVVSDATTTNGLDRTNSSLSRRPSISSFIGGGSISSIPSLSTVPLSKLSSLNSWLRAFQPLQLVLGVLIGVHIVNNLSLLLGLNAPHHSMTQEPDMHYSKNFASIRWLLTGLDAATLSVLKVKIPFVKHVLWFFLSIYYLLNRIAAENKVNAFRRSMTHEAVRACWEKGSTPILAAVDRLMRKRCTVDLELIELQSPDGHKIECRLFYHKPRGQLQNETRLLLDFPGGGFIAMNPGHHADYLSHWAQQLGVPIVSVNYRKSPQFPFPCAFEDCWHVYKQIVDSNGSVVGINCGEARSNAPIKLAVAGDSAGGNLTAAVTVKAIVEKYRVPDGIHMIYPVLDFAGEIWRSTSLPPKNAKRVRAKEHKPRRKQLLHPNGEPVEESAPAVAVDLAEPLVQHHRPDDSRRTPVEAHSLVDPRATSPSSMALPPPEACAFSSPSPSATSLRPSPPKDIYGVPQLSSRTMYAFDGVLPYKYMLLLADCYFKNGGDPVNDPYASPSAASDSILAKFPPIYSHVGSVDPLVDDVVKFARRAQIANPKSDVFVCVIPKVSHAYLHVTKFLPEAKLAVDLSSVWLAKILDVSAPASLNLDARMKELNIEVTNMKNTLNDTKTNAILTGTTTTTEQPTNTLNVEAVRALSSPAPAIASKL